MIMNRYHRQHLLQLVACANATSQTGDVIISSVYKDDQYLHFESQDYLQ
jgi:hypothetical protein